MGKLPDGTETQLWEICEREEEGWEVAGVGSDTFPALLL
jgi:hypothetical protein